MTQVEPSKRAAYWLTEEGLNKIYDWAFRGLIDEDIAHNMGIGRSTLYLWKNNYPEIDAAIQAGNKPVDERVEGALLKRAFGYEYTEKYYEYFPVLDEDGESTGKTMKVLVREVEKHLPGDVKAMMNWLKNRRPDIWKDRHELEVNTNTESSDKLANILGQLMGVEENDVIEVDFKGND